MFLEAGFWPVWSSSQQSAAGDSGVGSKAAVRAPALQPQSAYPGEILAVLRCPVAAHCCPIDRCPLLVPLNGTAVLGDWCAKGRQGRLCADCVSGLQGTLSLTAALL